MPSLGVVSLSPALLKTFLLLYNLLLVVMRRRCRERTASAITYAEIGCSGYGNNGSQHLVISFSTDVTTPTDN